MLRVLPPDSVHSHTKLFLILLQSHAVRLGIQVSLVHIPSKAIYDKPVYVRIQGPYVTTRRAWHTVSTPIRILHSF